MFRKVYFQHGTCGHTFLIPCTYVLHNILWMPVSRAWIDCLCNETRNWATLVSLCPVKRQVNLPYSLLYAVIDLGAAPGAWTAYFAGHVARVAAVDPAEMGADAMLQNVTHIRKAVSRGRI